MINVHGSSPMAPEKELCQPAHQLLCKEVHVLGSVAAAVVSEAHVHLYSCGGNMEGLALMWQKKTGSSRRKSPERLANGANSLGAAGGLSCWSTCHEGQVGCG